MTSVKSRGIQVDSLSYSAGDEDGSGPVGGELGIGSVRGSGNRGKARDLGVRLARQARGAARDTLIEPLAWARDCERRSGEENVDEEGGGEHGDSGQRSGWGSSGRSS